MKRNGIIERVKQPANWCAPKVPFFVVFFKKTTGKAHICIDLKRLNDDIKKHYILPTTKEIKAKPIGDELSSTRCCQWLLPNTIAPRQLYTYHLHHFIWQVHVQAAGITSTPEILQKKMETLQGLEVVEVFMDNILVYGATEEKHDSRLEKVMQCIEIAGLKLNRVKCSIRQNQLRFLGHLVDWSPPPEVKELQRILGIVNYLGRYIPNISTVKTTMACGPEK